MTNGRQVKTRQSRKVSFSMELLKDKAFMARVRDQLRTDEQRAYFDFVTDLPAIFLMNHAGERLTHKKIAEHLEIEPERVASLNKSLRRVFSRILATQKD